MERYTTITGEVVTYDEPEPAIASFLADLIQAANDPRVGESEIVERVYGTSNPLLEQGVLPHHGLVNKEVFGNPIYHVMLDLIGRKRVQVGTLDLDRAAAEYTLTVAQAAEQLDVHPSAVRQAVKARKLDAQKRGGTWFLRPSSVRSYTVSRRGPMPRQRRV